MALKKLCPRCNKIIDMVDGMCDECKAKKEERDHKAYDSKRGSAAQRGYDSRWRKYRINYLRKNTLCVQCLEEGQITAATVVDHIVPHKGNKKLFWDTNNHQALCKYHHDKKTATSDMGSWNSKKNQ